MEIVHVRGRVVREVRAYFLARYDRANDHGWGEDLATHETRFELDVDGRILTIELAPDIESHNRSSYVCAFREVPSEWDANFPFEKSPTGSVDDEIRVARFSYRAGEDLDVWGEVLETELAAAGYRDAPSKNPTVLRARAIDVPVRSPPVLSSWRIGFLLLLAAATAVAFMPMGPATPFARFWSLLVLSIATSMTHWRVIPNATNSRIWESAAPSLGVMYASIGVGLTLAMPLGPGWPWWMDIFACVVLGAHSFTSLYVRVRRMRRTRAVARRLSQGAELGIVRDISNRVDSVTSEVMAGDTVVVMLENEERTISLRDFVFDSHTGHGPRPGTRVLVGNGALYASWEDPRSELDQVLLWDGRLRWASAAFGIALPVITYLAYQAPRLAS